MRRLIPLAMTIAGLGTVIISPLLALLVGGMVSGSSQLNGPGAVATLATLIVSVIVFAYILLLLERAWWQDKPTPRQRPASWRRAYNERPSDELRSPLANIMTIIAVLAVVVFFVWVLLFAGSPLPQ